MYNLDMFTSKAVTAINLAIKVSGSMGHTYVGSEHLLLGLIKEGTNTASITLASYRVNEKNVSEKIKSTVGTGEELILTYECMTPALCRILSRSSENVKASNTKLVGTEHILYAILKEKNCTANLILQSLGVSISRLSKDCNYSGSTINEVKPTNPANELDNRQIPNLVKYGKNLTEQAYKKGFDPVIGRDSEIERVIQILSRRTKNNPCLIGEAGVGKTAIAEGLAQMIVNGEVPEDLRRKNIFALDIPSLLAGAKYRGDFEERIRTCINEVIKQGNIILFLDEIHTIVGAGAAEGAVDASNILKPQLARGEIQVIGATTTAEYRHEIEKDNALERRFQPVFVEEPSEEETINILKGLKANYEDYHNVTIPDDVLKLAVTHSIRYINDRFLPDKAIDLLDEACSRAKLRKSVHYRAKATSLSEFEQSQTSSTKVTLEDLHRSIYSEDKSYSSVCVTKQDVCNVTSAWTGIPLDRTSKDENAKILELESNLKRSIVGQDVAVKSIADSIARNRCGLRDEKRPISSFLFLGSTGVGKTELSKALAKELFDSEDSLIRFDMSEYMEKHSVSKLIGSPPGYVGCEDGGQLTEQVRRRPYSIILFDEIEKAHNDVSNVMLQILDEGYLTDSNGRRVNFRNTIIVITSNVGSEVANRGGSIGFSQDVDKSTKDRVVAEAKKHFKPELLNRIDDIIVFERLNTPQLEHIAKKLLDELSIRASRLDVTLSFDSSAIKLLALEKSTSEYGARPLKRKISESIETPLSEQILLGGIKSGDKVYVYGNDGKFTIQNYGKVSVK